MSDIPEKPATDRSTHNIPLDLSKLDLATQTYPADVRESTVWLGGYIVRRCSRSLDILETQIRDLGFQTTASTISKILRGKWTVDAQGKKIAPVMAAQNFLQLVEKLRVEDRLRELAGQVPFVETSTWNDIRNYIDTRRAQDRICKFGLIAGPTGAQKSCCFKEYCRRNNHGACIHIESPAKPRMGDFLSKLCVAYGASIHDSIHAQKRKIAECVNARRTIIIDNIQKLYVPGAGWDQPTFHYLQELQDDTRCTIILSATMEFHRRLMGGMAAGHFEQFEGRCGGRSEFMLLPEHAPREDVLHIASAFGLHQHEKHFAYLEKISQQPGRIRVLFQRLQTAKQLADAEQSKLTIKHLRSVMDEIMADEEVAA